MDTVLAYVLVLYLLYFYPKQYKTRLEKLRNQVDYHGRCKKMRDKLEK